MSETSFPINDLLRRKSQTALVVISLALTVGSALFLLLSAERIGFDIFLSVEDKLTSGISGIFSQFVLFLVALIISAGVVMASFMVSLMMSQRTKDIGLIKAAGCPNELVFGYFFTELLVVVFLGCFLGTLLGFLADFSSSISSNALSLRAGSFELNSLTAPIVFALFLVIGMIVGTKSIIDASKTAPINLLSPEYRFGVAKETGFKTLSKRSTTFAVALRSLVRRKSATVKIVLVMSIVFTLVTVGVAGGLSASRTTQSWIEKAISKDTVLIAHKEMCTRYSILLRAFYEGGPSTDFNYTDSKYVVPQELIEQMTSHYGVANVEKRIITEADVREVQGYVLQEESQDVSTVGDHRNGRSLLVGIDPEKTQGHWHLDGRQLAAGQTAEILVGDTLSRDLLSVPLAQRLEAFDSDFDVVGVCIDPINNGNVGYIHYDVLQAASGILGANLVLLKIDMPTNGATAVQQIDAIVKAVNPNFTVLDLGEFLSGSLGFLSYAWSTMMVLPVFSLVAASLCLVGYMVLAMEEQRHEYGVMRATGARSNTILRIVSGQGLLVLLSSYGVGVALGIIITLLVLIHDPVITAFTVFEIATWQAMALGITLISSLYPAIRFARKPLFEILRQN
jgi:ABC-type antimicrobial peptide transport system permease subunit